MSESEFSFLDTWFDESVDVSFFDKHLNIFLKQFEDSIYDIVIKLLNYYIYLSPYNTELLFSDYLEKLKSFLATIDTNDYVIIPLFQDDKAHNSFVFHSLFKSIPNYRSKLNPEEFKNYRIIILVDDYSGSGSELKNFDDNYNCYISNSTTLYFLPCLLTEFAKENIENSARLNKYFLNLSVSNKKESRYISKKKILTDSEVERLEEYCKNFVFMDIGTIYGFNRAEDLTSFYYFTPNDTIGLFWYDGYPLYQPLFGRDRSNMEKMTTITVFSFKIIKGFKECLKPSVSKKMRRYILIAILLKNSMSRDDISKVLRFSNYEMNRGLEYLNRQEVLNFKNEVNDTVLGKYIDIDVVNLFVYIGIPPKSSRLSSIISNFQKAK